jgi:hypothetical protein
LRIEIVEAAVGQVHDGIAVGVAGEERLEVAQREPRAVSRWRGAEIPGAHERLDALHGQAEEARRLRQAHPSPLVIPAHH